MNKEFEIITTCGNVSGIRSQSTPYTTEYGTKIRVDADRIIKYILQFMELHQDYKLQRFMCTLHYTILMG